MNNTIETTINNSKEAFVATGEALFKTAASTTECAANSTTLVAHGLYITIDTANIGIKQILAWAPKDGEECIDRTNKAVDKLMDLIDDLDDVDAAE